jgi:hypothetical protein
VKRSQQLAPLSREHHAALEVALRLRRATDADAAAVRERFLRFYETEAREHFRAEEEHLLPAFARHAPADDPDIVRVLVEHVELRRRAVDVARGAGPEELHALGDLLRDHVRHEERTLFPRVEAALAADELAALGELLHSDCAAQAPPP